MNSSEGITRVVDRPRKIDEGMKLQIILEPQSLQLNLFAVVLVVAIPQVMLTTL